MKQRKTEHPILMCSDMVRAILDEKKTETRRMAGLKHMNLNPNDWIVNNIRGTILGIGEDQSDRTVKHPYGVAGDTLWVRETWGVNALSHLDASVSIRYQAGGLPSIDNFAHDFQKYFDQCWDDCKKLNRFVWDSQADCPYRWRPSIHIPRWASRITLTVKGVTLERLHSITDEDARAEGVKDRAEYEKLWIELNGAESWNLNPWVWVVKFEVANIRS